MPRTQGALDIAASNENGCLPGDGGAPAPGDGFGGRLMMTGVLRTHGRELAGCGAAGDVAHERGLGVM